VKGLAHGLIWRFKDDANIMRMDIGDIGIHHGLLAL